MTIPKNIENYFVFEKMSPFGAVFWPPLRGGRARMNALTQNVCTCGGNLHGKCVVEMCLITFICVLSNLERKRIPTRIYTTKV